MSSTTFEAEVERNYRHNYIVNFLDGTFFWLGSNFIAWRTILPLYISNYTDSEFALGLLATIGATGWLLPQLFTSNWVQRLPQKKVVPVRLGLFTERLPVILLVPASSLAIYSPSLALFLFFVLFAWFMIGAGVVAVGWQDMIAKIFPVNRRGRFFGVTNFSGTATGVLGAAAAAWFLDHYGFPYNYTICFAFAGLFIFISWLWLSQTREPAQVSKQPVVAEVDYLRHLPSIIQEDVNFRRFLISQIVISMGGMAAGFLTVYAVQRWQLPEGQAGIYTVSMLVGQAVGNLIFGPLADRRGHKLVLEFSTILGILSVGIASIAPSSAWFLLVFALAGVSNAGVILSGIMIVFEFSPAEIRPTYIGLNNTLVGIAAALAPLLGAWLASTLGYQALFIVAFSIGVVGYILLRWTVREPREAHSALDQFV